MKKITLVLAILIASLSTINGQISFSVPIGYSSENAPMIGSNLQLNIGHFIIGGGFDAHISKAVSKGDLYWSRLGGSFNLSELNTLEVTFGAGTYSRSHDNKALNDGVGLFNAAFVHQMASRPEGAVFAGITTTNQFFFVSGGIRFIFKKRERDGCPSTWVR